MRMKSSSTVGQPMSKNMWMSRLKFTTYLYSRTLKGLDRILLEDQDTLSDKISADKMASCEIFGIFVHRSFVQYIRKIWIIGQQTFTHLLLNNKLNSVFLSLGSCSILSYTSWKGRRFLSWRKSPNGSAKQCAAYCFTVSAWILVK